VSIREYYGDLIISLGFLAVDEERRREKQAL